MKLPPNPRILAFLLALHGAGKVSAGTRVVDNVESFRRRLADTLRATRDQGGLACQLQIHVYAAFLVLLKCDRQTSPNAWKIETLSGFSA